MQLKRGARASLIHIYSDIDYLIENAHDPIAVELLARRIRERIKAELEPRLERAASAADQPTLERHVIDLLARVERLERKDGTG